jgi:stage II sporulation protein AA (anti-sigma F factor antagonist)
LSVKIKKEGRIMIISISGDLDQHNAEFVRRKIDYELIKYPIRYLIFNLSELEFMDSSGIGVILGRYKQIKNFNGKAAIVKASPQIRRIFELSGVFKIIPEFSSVNEAIGNI